MSNNNSSLHIKIVIITLILIIIIGTFSFKYLEGWSYVDSFYFSVATMTTVGYGDLVPTSDISKIFLSFYSLVGVTLYISTAVVLGDKYLEHAVKKHSRK